ncbi:PepSY domain-containing protein [Candidatus Methylomirabilis sp.]|uniref:WD40/YVTN/BNR-like repeat-containing protein n=1 Tax=Candidatus Methylomirabilis sp. TaxID=2032687 RepID=UPI002A5B727A|nr:PepSY domain-containing protein [Candidatus Methylomirabilis sp.]
MFSTHTRWYRRITLLKLHKWAGLISAVWLCVLGATGFLLDHKEWRWIWFSTVPERLMPGSVRSLSRTVIQIFQVNPNRPMHQVAAGSRGLWVTEDGAKSWQRTQLVGDKDGHLQVFAVEPDPERGWDRLWIGTDNGIWVSADGGKTVVKAGMEAQRITALSAGASHGELYGVTDRSRVFQLLTGRPDDPLWLRLETPPNDALPHQMSLRRLIIDLHVGRGLFAEGLSLLLNDLAGLGLCALALSGVCYWGFPKYWRHRRRHGGQIHVETKRTTLIWLFRFHSPLIGLYAALPLLYLVITGIFFGHSKELGEWLRRVQVPSIFYPPVYHLNVWDGWIEAVIGYPGQPEKLSIGTRVGLFTSEDGGRTWSAEHAGAERIAAARRLRRFGDSLYIGGWMGINNYMKPQDGAGWLTLSDKHAHMTSDITRLEDGQIGWLHHGKTVVMTDRSGQVRGQIELTQPVEDGVPWYYVLRQLHDGLIFWQHWKWLNDLFAVLAITLVVTGLIRWWRVKWL